MSSVSSMANSYANVGRQLMENDSSKMSSVRKTTNLMLFSDWFSQIHGYASICICVFGIFANFFNVSILLRRDMRTPTNLLLMWLAIFDILTMAPYIPFAAHFYCPPKSPQSDPQSFGYSWAMYMLVNINLVATTHTITIWIGVVLAVIRFIQMRSKSRGPIAKERRMRQVKVMTVITCVLSALILVPNYLTNQLQHISQGNVTYYTLRDLQLATNHTDTIVLINVVAYAIVAKLMPCVLILCFGGSLICTLTLRGRSRRRRLTLSNSKQTTKARQSTTTKMLLVVIILFLLTELPQAILILLAAFIPGFYYDTYMTLGDLMDFTALLNNAINFVLYCIMSQQFRSRFVHMFLRRHMQLKTEVSDTMITSDKLVLRETAAATTVSY